MKIIYLHEESGKTFKTKKGYENFDKKFQEEKANKLKLKYKIDDYRNFPRLNATSFTEYAKLCVEYINKINEGTGIIYSDLKFYNLYYNENLSNTHNSPIGKPTNWWNKPDIPAGYPGWGGRVTFKKHNKSGKSHVSSNDHSEIHSPYRGILGLNTGSGGGGYNEFTYDIKLFLDDFPLIKEKYERQQKLLRLKKEHDDDVYNLYVKNTNNDFLYNKMNIKINKIDDIISILSNKRAHLIYIQRELEKYHREETTELNPFPFMDELNSLDVL